MVAADKIFKLRENETLTNIMSKLKELRKEESFDRESLHIKLLTEIHDLSLTEKTLQGVWAEDAVTYVTHHGERILVPKTIEVPFAFVQRGEEILLVVMERKLLANNIANKLSEELFVTTGFITVAKIPPEVLKDFHEKT